MLFLKQEIALMRLKGRVINASKYTIIGRKN